MDVLGNFKGGYQKGEKKSNLPLRFIESIQGKLLL
jgi:hypothetical protein